MFCVRHLVRVILFLLLVQNSLVFGHGNKPHHPSVANGAPLTKLITIQEENTPPLHELFWLPPLHPLVVHFPIAFMLLGGGLSLINFFKKSETLFTLTRWLLYLTSFWALAATVSGLYFEKFVLHRHRGNSDFVMEWHEMSGIILTFSVFALSILAHFGRKNLSPWFRHLIGSSFILLSFFLIITAHLGGLLVHRFGVGL